MHGSGGFQSWRAQLFAETAADSTSAHVRSSRELGRARRRSGVSLHPRRQPPQRASCASPLELMLEGLTRPANI